MSSGKTKATFGAGWEDSFSRSKLIPEDVKDAICRFDMAVKTYATAPIRDDVWREYDTARMHLLRTIHHALKAARGLGSD